jgi:hypothetical protein
MRVGGKTHVIPEGFISISVRGRETTMQDHVKLFVKTFSELVPDSPIYEFGSLQVPGQEGFADLRSFFPGKEYIGCDMQPGAGVDKIEDMEKGLTIQDGSASAVLCMDTLEHVFDVFTAMKEMNRILRDDEGILIASSLFHFKIHSYPFDYWRFTPYCLLRLFSSFDVALIGGQGNPESPISVFGIGIKTKDKTAWRDTLLKFQQKYEDEFKNIFKYDKTLPKKIKLSFYKIFVPKKYIQKKDKTRMTWNIKEKNT